MKRITSMLFSGILAMALLSCSSDDPVTPEQPIQPAFADQTQREHTLTNLVRAYNDRNADAVNNLLAPDYVFYFGQADIDDGRVSDPSWDRASEVTATQNMFDPALGSASAGQFSASATEETTWGQTKSLYASASQQLDPVSRITLNMTWTAGEDTWSPYRSKDEGLSTPEPMFVKTIQYTLAVSGGDYTFTNAQALSASIVIRQYDDGDGNMIYQIVQWRDDI